MGRAKALSHIMKLDMRYVGKNTIRIFHHLFYLPFPLLAELKPGLKSDHCRTLTPGHDAVQKVTLIPRGQAKGLTWFIPSDDPTLISKKQLYARIVGGLGGRAAEEVIFGEPEVTTGAGGDLQQITGLAKQVVHNVNHFYIYKVFGLTASLQFNCSFTHKFWSIFY